MAIIGETSYTGTANGNVAGGNNQEMGGNKLSDKQKKQITAILGVVAAVVVAAGAYLAVESGNQAAKPADKPMESEPDGGDVNVGTPVITENPETNTTTVAMPGETPTEKEAPTPDVGLIIGGINVDVSEIIQNIPEKYLQEKICEEIRKQCSHYTDSGKKVVSFEITTVVSGNLPYCSVGYDVITADGTTRQGIVRVAKS